MKWLVLAALLAGCATTSPVLNPLQSAGCAVETTVTTAFGGVIVTQCGGTDINACGTALLTALGNVNMCSQPVAPASAMLSAKSLPKWNKVGDVTQADLSAAKQSMSAKAVTPKGVIGSVVCPLAYTTIVGLVTGIVPKSCGCTKNLDAGALGDALVTACAAAIPI